MIYYSDLCLCINNMYSIKSCFFNFLLSSTLALFAARTFFLLFNYKYLSRCIVGTLQSALLLKATAGSIRQTAEFIFLWLPHVWLPQRRQDLYSCLRERKMGEWLMNIWAENSHWAQCSKCSHVSRWPSPSDYPSVK